MYVLSDGRFKGLRLTLTSVPSPNPEFVTRGERFDIELFSRSNAVSFVNPDKGEMSDIALKRRFSDVRLFNSARAEISDIWSFSERVRSVRLVKLVKADRFHTESCCPSRRYFRLVNFAKGEMFKIGLPKYVVLLGWLIL